MTDQEIEKIYINHATLNEHGFLMLSQKKALDFARALLSRAIPEGHVVVPKEPTLQMCAAACYTHGTPCAPEIIHRAMIAAAAPANKEG